MVPFARNGLEIFCEYEGMGKYLWYIDKKWEKYLWRMLFYQSRKISHCFY